LKRHEINGNYYAVKKICGKIKTHAFRSGSGIAITVAERKRASGWLEKGKTSFQPASVLPDNRPALSAAIPCQFFLCPKEAYAQTLIFVHDGSEP
jgi:hypothetical protein